MRDVLSGIRSVGILAPLALVLAILPEPVRGAEELIWPEKPVIVGMLLDRDFARLEATLTAYQGAYERGEVSDQWPTTAFRSFEYADPTLEHLFEEWMVRIPDSHVAYLARGIYFTHLGWISRGTAVISLVPRIRVEDMLAYFARASADLERAIGRNGALMVAYATLMDMAAATGDEERELRFRSAALEIDPGSPTIHWARVTKLQSKWGGSLRQISAYIDDVLAQFPDDPELGLLRGYPDYIVGQNLSLDGKYRKALRYFNRALAIGETPFYLAARGDHYYGFEHYDLAVVDYERILEIDPHNEYAIYSLAYLYLVNDDPADNPVGEAYIDRALELDPYDPELLQIKAHFVKRANEHMDAAVPYLEKAAVYGVHDHTVFASLGMAYRYSEVIEDREWNAENMARAAAAYRRASELQPENPEYVLMYMLSLGATGSCDLLEPFENYARLCTRDGECTGEHVEFQRSVVEDRLARNQCELAGSP